MNVMDPQSPGAWVILIVISLCIGCLVLPRLLEFACFTLLWVFYAPYTAWYEFSIWQHRRKRVCPQPEPTPLVGIVIPPPAPAADDAPAANAPAVDAPQGDAQAVVVPAHSDEVEAQISQHDTFGPI
jgi:hypothetical protein